MEDLNTAKKFIQEKKYDKALNALKVLRDKDPSNPLYYKLIGDCYHNIKKFKRMILYWTKAKRLGFRDKNLDTALTTHSLKFRAEQHPDEFIDNPYCLDSFKNGMKHLEKLRFDEAIKSFDEAISKGPEYFSPWLNKALAYYYKEEFDKVIECAKKAIDIKPKEGLSWFNLGTFYNKKNDWPNAIYALKKATSFDTEDAAYWYNLGFAYFHNKQYKEALKCVEEAEDISPSYALAQWQMALCHANLKNKEKTILALRKALLNMPAWKQYVKNQKAFEWLKGDNEFEELY